MLASDAKVVEPRFVVNPLARAFAISLVIHLALYGGVKLGQRNGWWRSIQYYAKRVLRLAGSLQGKMVSLNVMDAEPVRLQLIHTIWTKAHFGIDESWGNRVDENAL